jgi:hypothetical protein
VRRKLLAVLATVVCGLVLAEGAQAQYQVQPWPYQLQRFYYYPFYYFPHNYWPAMSPKWPEGPNEPYRKPPAYMAYPPFLEPNWRYEMFTPQRYYRGFHFWLDQF